MSLQKEISEIESKAEANINEDKSKMEVMESGLKGLPQEQLAHLPIA